MQLNVLPNSQASFEVWHQFGWEFSPGLCANCEAYREWKRLSGKCIISLSFCFPRRQSVVEKPSKFRNYDALAIRSEYDSYSRHSQRSGETHLRFVLIMEIHLTDYGTMKKTFPSNPILLIKV